MALIAMAPQSASVAGPPTHSLQARAGTTDATAETGPPSSPESAVMTLRPSRIRPPPTVTGIIMQAMENAPKVAPINTERHRLR